MPLPDKIFNILTSLRFPNLEHDVSLRVPPLPGFVVPRAPALQRPRLRPYRLLVQILGIIDTRKFTGLWHGQVLKCVAYPDTSNLSAGDVVIVTRLEKSTEYFYREVTGVEILYFTPGYDKAGSSTQGELWKYDGSTPPVYVWTCPNANEHITGLFWTNLTEKLYICTLYTGSPMRSRIYKCDIATDPEAITLVVGPYTHPDLVDSDAGCDAAEFGDSKVYVHHGSMNFNNEFVSRFDPVAETITHVLRALGDWGPGGIAVHKGNGYLYWTGGWGGLYRSANGDAGTWTIVNALTNHFYCGNLVTYRGDDNIYFTAWEFGGDTKVFRINTDGSVSLEYSYTPASLFNLSYYLLTMGVLYTSGVATQLFVLPSSWDSDITLPVYAENGVGVWGVDATLDQAYRSNPNQNLVCANDLMHLLVTALSLDYLTYDTRLLKRTSPGTWEIVYTWDGYYHAETNFGILAATPVETCVFAHEM